MGLKVLMEGTAGAVSSPTLTATSCTCAGKHILMSDITTLSLKQRVSVPRSRRRIQQACHPPQRQRYFRADDPTLPRGALSAGDVGTIKDTRQHHRRRVTTFRVGPKASIRPSQKKIASSRASMQGAHPSLLYLPAPADLHMDGRDGNDHVRL
ncbi:uncharacterized protein ARMOST_20243 [Armillaria ostoyae]|uniref:Uncharacterized protein n=1 Tax=Armillaria ostoyae TaxID=47428 RepID=A0A284S6U5_ARMOS|nr:uncharacterized protein ARMOST_20243 [Armillaria ostoyae]